MSLLAFYGFLTTLNLVLWFLSVVLNELNTGELPRNKTTFDLTFGFVWWVVFWPLSYSVWVLKQLLKYN